MTEHENTQTETAETAIEQTNIKRRENGRPATVVIQLTSPPADGETLRHESDDATVTVEADTDASSTRATLGDEDGYANVRVVLSKWEVQTLSTMGRARWEDGSGEHTTRFTITIGQALGERDAEESPFSETDDGDDAEVAPDDDVPVGEILPEWSDGCPNCGREDDTTFSAWRETPDTYEVQPGCTFCDAPFNSVTVTEQELAERRGVGE